MQPNQGRYGVINQGRYGVMKKILIIAVFAPALQLPAQNIFNPLSQIFFPSGNNPQTGANSSAKAVGGEGAAHLPHRPGAPLALPVVFDVFSHFHLERHLQHPSRPSRMRFSRSDFISVLTMPSTSTVVYFRTSVSFLPPSRGSCG